MGRASVTADTRLPRRLPYLRDFRFSAAPPAWSADFDHWAAAALDQGDIDALAGFHGAPAVRYAHPTTENYAPLFVTLGAGDSPVPVTTISGYWPGLAKRSVQVAWSRPPTASRQRRPHPPK